MTSHGPFPMFQVRNSRSSDRTGRRPGSHHWRHRAIEESGLAMQYANQNKIEALEDVQLANPNGRAGRLQEDVVTEISGDRRSHRRYPLKLQLTYKVMRR